MIGCVISVVAVSVVIFVVMLAHPAHRTVVFIRREVLGRLMIHLSVDDVRQREQLRLIQRRPSLVGHPEEFPLVPNAAHLVECQVRNLPGRQIAEVIRLQRLNLLDGECSSLRTGEVLDRRLVDIQVHDLFGGESRAGLFTHPGKPPSVSDRCDLIGGKVKHLSRAKPLEVAIAQRPNLLDGQPRHLHVGQSAKPHSVDQQRLHL